MIKGRPLFFWPGGGDGKFWNKLFAEAVNTEVNCTQEKKKCLQEDGNTRKKFFAAGPAYKIIIFACDNFSTLPSPPPSKKIMVRPWSDAQPTPHSKLKSFNKITCAYMWASIILYACRDPTSLLKSQRADRWPKNAIKQELVTLPSRSLYSFNNP